MSMMGTGHSSVHLALLGGFRLLAGDDQLVLSNGSERLLAFLALSPGTVSRSLMAATLWPDTAEPRAHSSLRSALARLGALGRRILHIGTTEIGLSPEVGVDFHEARSLAQSIVDPTVRTEPADVSTQAVEVLSLGLLPGWYEDWVLTVAEEWHELRLHGLEALSTLFVRQGRFADAVAAATVAAHAEPLRESACAALIRAYLAEGNQAEALRHFQRYERRLRTEAGLHPTLRLRELVADLHTVRSR